jgi:hypothetical protein
MKTLRGDQLGRIQIVELLPHGSVDLHIDAGRYFDVHGRYHIPFVTHPEVYFIDGKSKEHMEAGSLYRLKNLEPHGVKNDSDFIRTHLIIDVQVGEHQ